MKNRSKHRSQSSFPSGKRPGHGKRRAGRILAMQVLYGLDSSGRFEEARDHLRRFFENLDIETKVEVREFAAELFQGVVARQQEIDEILERASNKWRVERMSQVDRNVMRIAVCELLTHPEIPAPVVINEAVDIGKSYGHAESGSFINGVLNRVVEELQEASGR